MSDRDLVSLMRTSKAWFMKARNSEIWIAKYRELYPIARIPGLRHLCQKIDPEWLKRNKRIFFGWETSSTHEEGKKDVEIDWFLLYKKRRFSDNADTIIVDLGSSSLKVS